ncbi:uncharacterized protein LOC110098272 [Dendrobium catenatum]|uniref:uncharacterized protein LOC110098272 n=1 Tax=Dendrobium catenatum TaxID=906689 RepID=UPI0009F53346|nr:uncharacterized protein LOC110098272 [Dendrobium catenatum]
MDLLCYQCGQEGHDKKECPDDVIQGINDQIMGRPDAGTGERKRIASKVKPSVIKSEYGPWIHVQFKNRRLTKGRATSRGVNGYNGIRLESMGDNYQKVIVQKQIQKEKEIIVAVDNSVLDSKNWPDSEKDSMEKPEEIDKLKDTGVELIDPVLMNNGTGAGKKEESLNLKEIVRDQDVFFIGKVVSFVVKETSSQVIFGDLYVPNLGSWKVATVYGSRYCKERGSLWSQLERCMEDSIPSIIGGDFNCILNKEEKRGGKRFLFSGGPRDMKCFMKNSDFHDVRSIGPRFTWCNNKEGASRIWERLDRCLMNSVALQKLPLAIIRHLVRVASDHSPIVFKLDERVRLKLKTIRFEDTWRSYPMLGVLCIIHGRKMTLVMKEKLKREILELQNKEALREDWSADDLFLLKSEVHDLNVTLRRLSTRWNQRAKARWHEVGDTNSKLFHNFATVFIHYFQAKWKSRDCELSGWPLVSENQKLNPDDVAALNSEFSVSELQMSVFQQGNNRSPDTLIVLITKVKNPLIPSNYRPISLCQTNYKIAATMLVNRLKNCISKMIAEEQMAFIPGRSISEHYLLAQEIFHKFKISKSKKGLMAIMFDMEQAYDSMGWPTLGHILKWYGFPSMFSNLLMECVVDVRFSIIINGKISKWINAQSRFRQGFPLSPYLFIMCSQLMSNSLEQRGQTLGIQISPRGPKITHILYADDVLTSSHVSLALAKALKVIVEDFSSRQTKGLMSASHRLFSARSSDTP